MRDPINKNNAIYYDSIKSYPNDFRGVKWESPESQFLRFKILCEISPLLFQSFVLDVGCGMGHLVDYLQTNNFTGDYQGIDLCNEMILSAQKRHPAFYFADSILKCN